MAGTLVVDTINSDTDTNLTIDPNGTGVIVAGADIDIATHQLSTKSDNRDIELAPHGTGAVEVRGNTNAGTIKLNCENNSHAVSVQGPAHSAAATYTLVLPTAAGTANQILDIASVSGSTIQLGWADDASGASVSAANEWTAGQRGEVTNIDSSSGVLAIDFDASNNFLCITTENITDINYTNLDQDMVGQTGSIFFQYGGAHTVGGWDTETRWIGGTGGTNNAPTFTATNGQLDRVDYIIVGDRDAPSERAHVRVQMVASLNYAD